MEFVLTYNIEDIEAQILSTLAGFTLDQDQLDNGVLGGETGLANARVATHVGEIDARTFLDPETQEGFIKILPFALVQYQGRTVVERFDAAQRYVHRVTFRIFCGAKSLRKKREAQLSAYVMLRQVYDLLHGRWAYSNQPLDVNLPTLSGTKITTTGFNTRSPLLCGTGQDERLIAVLPQIVVYRTDYTVDLVT